ncbi:MAG: hypothetical protein H6623_06650 [Bdellovibrionaceae bacterium]|nr:hypothetical protein [Pseudobdellovibrionaceae bacterium]
MNTGVHLDTASASNESKLEAVVNPSESLVAGSFSMAQGERVDIEDMHFQFQMDGSLVLYNSSWSAVWAKSISTCTGQCVANFQSDGNFVVRDNQNIRKYFSGTIGAHFLLISNSPPFLRFTDYSGSTHFYPKGVTFAQDSAEVLDGAELILQGDGNFVIYAGPGITRPVWWSGGKVTNQTSGVQVITTFQTDGNLVSFQLQRSAQKQVAKRIWSSGTSGQGYSMIASKYYPYVSIRDSSGKQIWPSNSSTSDFNPVMNTNPNLTWGAWLYGISNSSQSLDLVRNFKSDLGLTKTPNLVGQDIWWNPDASWSNFNTLLNSSINGNPDHNWATDVSNSGSTPVLLWSPAIQVACDPKNPQAFIDNLSRFSLKQVAAGTFDSYIDTWADQIKAWGKPIILRTMHELNANTSLSAGHECDNFAVPWQAQLRVRGKIVNRPADAKTAWQHIVQRFRLKNVTNVRWVWSVLSWPSQTFGGNNSISVASIYPGDDYVDWIGIECYNNFVGSGDGIWKSCVEHAFGIYSEIVALTSIKPISLVEMGSTEQSSQQDPTGTAKGLWVNEALDVNNPNSIYQKMPRIQAIMYWNDNRPIFNSTSSDGGALWIQSSKSARDGFRSAIEGSAYPDN